MKIKGTVLSAKQEIRSLISKSTGQLKQHTVNHILLLTKDGDDTEVLNCEGWNNENFVLPQNGKEWISPPIRSINFEGSVGTVKF